MAGVEDVALPRRALREHRLGDMALEEGRVERPVVRPCVTASSTTEHGERDEQDDEQQRHDDSATEADARLWEIETRAAAVGLRGAASVTFAGYAEGWLARFIYDAPDRARFEAALARMLLSVLGELPLLEVLEAHQNELDRELLDTGGDGQDDVARKCLHLILEDAAEDLRAGPSLPSRRHPIASST